jgi:hypothetical protein
VAKLEAVFEDGWTRWHNYMFPRCCWVAQVAHLDNTIYKISYLSLLPEQGIFREKMWE